MSIVVPKRITIPESRQAEDDEQHYIEYHLLLDNISCGWRRYSEFDDLRLRCKNYTRLEAAVFPPKRLFNTSHVQLERRVGLEKWLAALLSQVDPFNDRGMAQTLRAFFNTEPWKRPNNRGGSTTTTTTIVHEEDEQQLFSSPPTATVSSVTTTTPTNNLPPPPPWHVISAQLDAVVLRYFNDLQALPEQQPEEEEKFDLADFEHRLAEAEAMCVVNKT